jgi:hypothetical protein
MSNSIKNVTSNVAYSDIRTEANESKDIHNELANRIVELRLETEDRALHSPYNLFDDSQQPLLCRQSLDDMTNVSNLRKYDVTFDNSFLFNKSSYLEKAGQN